MLPAEKSKTRPTGTELSGGFTSVIDTLVESARAPAGISICAPLGCVRTPASLAGKSIDTNVESGSGLDFSGLGVGVGSGLRVWMDSWTGCDAEPVLS